VADAAAGVATGQAVAPNSNQNKWQKCEQN